MSEQLITGRKRIGEISWEVQQLAGLLGSLKPGEGITYTDLSRAARRDVIKNRHLLYTARRKLRREKQMVFGTDRGVGLRRLDDSGVSEKATGTLKGIHRKVRNELKDQACVSIDNLTGAELVAHNGRVATLGVVGQFTHRKTLPGTAAAPLPGPTAEETLEALYRPRRVVPR